MIDYTIRPEIAEIDRQAAGLLNKYNNILGIASTYLVVPRQVIGTADDANRVKRKIREIQKTKYLSGFEELALREIGRNLSKVEFDLREMPKRSDMTAKDLIEAYSVPKEDLEYLKVWLKSNRNEIQDSVDMKCEGGLKRLDVDFAVPEYQSFADTEGKQLVDRFFGAIKEASIRTSGIDLNGIKVSPTRDNTAYYNDKEKAIRIGMPYIFSLEEGKIKPIFTKLLGAFGHEGFGHARNFSLTEKANIPETIKKDIFWKTSTIESVAQYYSDVFIEYAKSNPDIQERMGIENFKETYEEFEKNKIFNKFFKDRESYAIYLISKSLPKKEIIKRLNEVSLNNLYSTVVLEKFASKSELRKSIKYNLVYADRSVERSINAIRKRFGEKWLQQNESEIDKTLLTGFWTPEGYKEMTELFIQESK